jgi:hypothetical protein
MNMAKFTDANDPGYRKVGRELKRLVQIIWTERQQGSQTHIPVSSMVKSLASQFERAPHGQDQLQNSLHNAIKSFPGNGESQCSSDMSVESRVSVDGKSIVISFSFQFSFQYSHASHAMEGLKAFVGLSYSVVS